MAETDALKTKLEAKRSYHLREVERISKMLNAIIEAEHYLLDEPTQAKLVLTPVIAEAASGKSDRERIREALARMPDTFTTPDLHSAANMDGHGPEIARTSFAPYFSLLKKKGLVVEIQAAKGNTPGIYSKGPEQSKMPGRIVEI